MKLIVYGTPGPQGSKRHVGGGRMIESSAKVKPWRMDVKAAAEGLLAAVPEWKPIDAPVVVSMVFTLPAPASLPKRRASHAKRKPDLSKLVRSTEDALTDAGVWRDDARVVTCFASKTYPAGTLGAHADALDRPGVVIEIEEMPE